MSAIELMLIIFFVVPIVVLSIVGAVMACSMQSYSNSLKEERHG